MTREPYYITTPIYYVNDIPHIGHAYTSIAADVLARFMRLDGHEVLFLTGTDEHGQKIEKAARTAHKDPQNFTDQVSERFREMSPLLNLSEDQFIRTTEERHKKAAQALWQAIEKNGYIYKGSYAGWYSVRDEAFYAESELVDGKAPTGADVEWVEEPSYFFKLSCFQERLLNFYRDHPEFIGPETRRNEVVRFVEGGLHDLSISRSTFKWGVPVPGDEDHVMYVWMDALTNYITALGYPDINAETFKKFWPRVVHLVGKDIIRFHAVYWPAFLMAAGLPCPKRLFAHGWWTNEGQKISKSLGNTIDPQDLVREFGTDQIRFFLMREVPFGQDGDFSRAALIQRINSDLANDFGNLSQRVLAFIQKNADGKIPLPSSYTERDERMLKEAAHLTPALRDLVKTQSLHKMLEAIWAVISEANRYIDGEQPWALKKTDPARMKTVLYVLTEVLRHVGILTSPFMPVACAALLDQLSISPEDRTIEALIQKRLTPGTSLPQPSGLFPRMNP